MENSSPYIVVFAGANGAGKSTTISEYLKIDPIPYICPDIIASRLYILDEYQKYIVAMKEAEKQRKELMASKKSFAFETVLSTNEKINFLKRAKEIGYKILSVYVTTIDPNINIERIKRRVKKGGHSVPEAKTISRYEKSLKLLPDLINVSDMCLVYDNSNKVVAVFEKDNEQYRQYTISGSKLDKFVNNAIIVPLKEKKPQIQIHRELLSNTSMNFSKAINKIKNNQYEYLIYKNGKQGLGLYDKNQNFVGTKVGNKKEMEKIYGCKIKDPYGKLEKGLSI